MVAVCGLGRGFQWWRAARRRGWRLDRDDAAVCGGAGLWRGVGTRLWRCAPGEEIRSGGGTGCSCGTQNVLEREIRLAGGHSGARTFQPARQHSGGVAGRDSRSPAKRNIDEDTVTERFGICSGGRSSGNDRRDVLFPLLSGAGIT